jgi:AcrR family transcriptional regulator
LPQVKKPELASAVREAAFTLFARDGYTATSMAAIAAQAGTAVSNLYAYWPGKLDLLYDIYRPWLDAQLDALEQDVSRHSSPRSQLVRLFTGLWEDIPAADNAFANTLMEAMASVPRATRKPEPMLPRCERWLAGMLLRCLPATDTLARGRIAHVTWMAFDGFAISRRIGTPRDVKEMAAQMADLLLADHARLLVE